MTVAVPTLLADARLEACVESLASQSQGEVEIIVIDNSGQGLARRIPVVRQSARVLEMRENTGFGAAVNAAFEASSAPYFATLNDDAVAAADWLGRLVAAMEARPEVGMCASQVRLPGGLLDSAGMLVCFDASSKQRGHLAEPGEFSRDEEVLFPSASAALYRRSMLEAIGQFDGDFFLYCEDTDLGLRARWSGWKCLYVSQAVVEHAYSHSAGKLSLLKAYYAERNRLMVAAKNFPALLLPGVPLLTLVRYGWHALYLNRSRTATGAAPPALSRTRLAGVVLRAHLDAMLRLPGLWRKRRQVRRTASLSQLSYCRLLWGHSISPRQLAAL